MKQDPKYFTPTYFVLEKETERTLAMTKDKAVADFIVENYPVESFIRIALMQ